MGNFSYICFWPVVPHQNASFSSRLIPLGICSSEFPVFLSRSSPCCLSLSLQQEYLAKKLHQSTHLFCSCR